MSVCYGFEARKRTEAFLAAMKARAKAAASKYKEAELNMGIRTVADLERHDAYNAGRRAGGVGSNAEKYKAKAQKRIANIKADPEKYEEFLAKRREQARARRARKKAAKEAK